MAREIRHVALLTPTPGPARELLLHCYGREGARPKAYIQAALHADETPGLLVLHHLIRLLDEAEAQGAITGSITIVPYANPIGLSQLVNAGHLGRYELAGGGDFNRHWPDFAALIAEDLEGRLSDDAGENIALIRGAMAKAVAAMDPIKEFESLRHALAQEAVDADIVLDLHCDEESLMHLYCLPDHWPEAGDLAAELGCHAVLLAGASGGGPFDETFSTPWTRLAERFPDKPIPAACLAATLELRGKADVTDDLAAADAKALFRFLQRRGAIAGDAGALPELRCEATRLDACDVIRAPSAGVLSFAVALGQRVKEGDLIADLVDPAAEDVTLARRAIRSRAEGLVLSRRVDRYAMPGVAVAKVVGTQPLPYRQEGSLLED